MKGFLQRLAAQAAQPFAQIHNRTRLSVNGLPPVSGPPPLEAEDPMPAPVVRKEASVSSPVSRPDQETIYINKAAAPRFSVPEPLYGPQDAAPAPGRRDRAENPAGGVGRGTAATEVPETKAPEKPKAAESPGVGVLRTGQDDGEEGKLPKPLVDRETVRDFIQKESRHPSPARVAPAAPRPKVSVPEPAPEVVEVQIGRIELSLAQPPAPARRPAPPPVRKTLSLDSYLQRRRREP